MDYDPQILRTCPRTWRRELDLSAQADRRRQHSMLSLAVELGVYPDRVYDTVNWMIAELVVQDRTLEWDDLQRAVFTGPRHGGRFELPVNHAEGDDEVSDYYLTDDAVVYVLEHVRGPSFDAASPTLPVREQAPA